jgi:hypothetical protein
MLNKGFLSIKYRVINSLVLFVILTSVNSCVITRTPGFYSGYKHLESGDKSKVVIVKDLDSMPIIKDSFTYAITAKHLEQILKSSPKSIVYFWSPNCTGSACIRLSAFQNFCLINGYKPIIISEYFDFEMLSNHGIKTSEVFAINHWHYKTDYCNTYVRRFKESLFQLFNSDFNRKTFSKYLYYDGKTLSTNKPSDLKKYPWQ